MVDSPSSWGAVNIRLATTDPRNPRAVRAAIAAVFEAIANTCEADLQDYEGFPESDLADPDLARATAIARGDIAVDTTGGTRSTLLDAARLLRALEQAVLDYGRYIETDRDDELEALWRTPDGRHYVVPRLAALRPANGRPFLRRALLHHRVLPTHIRGFDVRLHRNRLALDAQASQGAAAGQARRYGAALFPGLLVKLQPPKDAPFLVESLSGFDCDAQVGEHLRKAHADDCCAIVWGELTMPEGSVMAVRNALAADGLSDEPAFRYVVAGSWHREAEGAMRNVASVIDGRGELMFEVLKWAKFKVGQQPEAITPGRQVHVLVGDDELTIFAVCRDFLQATGDVPYRDLNVDVAIVPSMIGTIDDRATLAGHGATADTMRVRFGTRTMVVAQPAKPRKRAVGKVMSFPAKPMEEKLTLVRDDWHVCILATG